MSGEIEVNALLGTMLHEDFGLGSVKSIQTASLEFSTFVLSTVGT